MALGDEYRKEGSRRVREEIMNFCQKKKKKEKEQQCRPNRISE